MPEAQQPAGVAHLTEPAEVAPVPTPAGTPHLSSDLPAQSEHLPDQSTWHLPGAAPVLAAEAPLTEPPPSAAPPTVTASSALWAALP
jgi:hypothetical protein